MLDIHIVVYEFFPRRFSLNLMMAHPEKGRNM
jgi:hypothetical protein